MTRVLIVDDEPQLLRALSIDLRGRHFEVDTATTGSTALAAAARTHLTRTEWNLLEVLLHNAGKLVESHQLLAQVWGPGYQCETNYLRVLHVPIARQARTRTLAPPAPAHRTGLRLPVPALRRCSNPERAMR
jgi:DNA-binding response OmpR family regulator